MHRSTKIYLIVFLASFLFVLVSSSAQFFAQAQYMEEDDVDDLIEDYHDTMNDLFNSRIKILVEKMLRDEESLKKKDLEEITLLLTPPPPKLDENGQPIGREACKGVGNQPPLSTYCLAQVSVDEYFKFRAGMLRLKGLARKEAGDRYEVLKKDEGDDRFTVSSGTGAGNIADRQLRNYGETINKIDREIEIARQTLDQALAAYNELSIALPLHRKYQEVITSLEKYRDNVSAIRSEIDLYPATFLNVTTPACT